MDLYLKWIQCYFWLSRLITTAMRWRELSVWSVCLQECRTQSFDGKAEEEALQSAFACSVVDLGCKSIRAIMDSCQWTTPVFGERHMAGLSTLHVWKSIRLMTSPVSDLRLYFKQRYEKLNLKGTGSSNTDTWRGSGHQERPLTTIEAHYGKKKKCMKTCLCMRMQTHQSGTSGGLRER